MLFVIQRSDGLIPAHAGSTTCLSFENDGEWAHPRSRGEHDAGYRGEIMLSGSSPLTRGAPTYLPKRIHYVGLIPAHAGSTG